MTKPNPELPKDLYLRVRYQLREKLGGSIELLEDLLKGWRIILFPVLVFGLGWGTLLGVSAFLGPLPNVTEEHLRWAHASSELVMVIACALLARKALFTTSKVWGFVFCVVTLVIVLLALTPGLVAKYTYELLAGQPQVEQWIGLAVFSSLVTSTGAILVGETFFFLVMSHEMVALFAPALPFAFGNMREQMLETAEQVVAQEIQTGPKAETLRYLQATAQVMIDSAAARFLPWAGIAALLSFNFEKVTTAFGSSQVSLINSFVPQLKFLEAVFLSIVLVAILMSGFSIMYYSFLDTLIAQVVVKQLELTSSQPLAVALSSELAHKLPASSAPLTPLTVVSSEPAALIASQAKVTKFLGWDCLKGLVLMALAVSLGWCLGKRKQ